MRNQWLVSAPVTESLLGLSDSTLVERVRHGDRECFALIMRRYNQRLFRVARSIVGSDNEAQDVVQHAWVCAYAHLRQFAGASAFSTWLIRIAINEGLARVKSRGRAQNLVADQQAPAWSSGTTAFANPEDDLSRRQLAALLETAIDELPESYRVTLLLREIEGLSTAEAAACLSISEEAVRARLHRARALLRDDLCERVGTVGPKVWSFAGERCQRRAARVAMEVDSPPARLEHYRACR